MREGSSYEKEKIIKLTRYNRHTEEKKEINYLIKKLFI